MRYTKEEYAKMINLTDLKERGWTNSMVEKLLPEPMLFPNPRYRSAAPMKRWWIEEVEAVEQTQEFQILFQKAAKRRASGYAVAAKRRVETMNMVNNVIENLQVQVLPKNVLERETLGAKEYWESQKSNFEGIYNVSDQVLVRWEVNFIRHNLTNYDYVLNNLVGLVGKAEAYDILKTAVLDKIGMTYPYLKTECERQKDAELNKALLRF